MPRLPKTNKSTFLCFIFFVGSIAAMLLNQGRQLLRFLSGQIGYYTFPISDWMINYEGGFVRRGLMGQLLYDAYQLTPYPVADAIAVIYYLSLACFAFFFIRTLVRHGISVFILPFSICLFYSLGTGFIEGRRDYIGFAMAAAIFFFYFRFLTQRKSSSLFAVYGLSFLTLIIYEPTFFFTFPILMLHTLVYYYNKPHRRSSLKYFLLLWWPALSTMALVTYFKGSATTATAIWASWADCMHRFPLDGNMMMGDGVQFLSNGLADALEKHTSNSWNGIGSLSFNSYVFAATYYLTTRTNTIDFKWYRLCHLDSIRLSNLMLVQLIAIFPLYGFLSFDWGRTIPYWVITSLLLYIALDQCQLSCKDNALVKKLTSISACLQQAIDRSRWLNHPLVYLFIIVSIPLEAFSGPALTGSFAFLPHAWKEYIINYFVSVFAT